MHEVAMALQDVNEAVIARLEAIADAQNRTAQALERIADAQEKQVQFEEWKWNQANRPGGPGTRF